MENFSGKTKFIIILHSYYIFYFEDIVNFFVGLPNFLRAVPIRIRALENKYSVV